MANRGPTCEILHVPRRTAMLLKKMEQAKTSNVGAYLWKMAIDGYIIYVDTATFRIFVPASELHLCSLH